MATDRHFCFTINNWTQEELNQLKKIELKKIKYIVCGEEVGEKGTPHLQCFITWQNVKTESACRKLLPPRAYVRHMYQHSNATASADYCKKDKKIAYEAGNPPRQGSRTDLKKVVDEVKEGKSIRKMVDDNTIKNHQGLKYAQELKKIYEKKRDWKPDVIWYWGKPGSGKTHKATQILKELAEDEDNIYYQMRTGQWWEGYDGQEYVLIDDLRANFMTFSDLIKLLDRYPIRVETKGSSRQFVAKVIIITSPFPPERAYHTTECINQLLDRIDLVKEFKGENFREKIKIERKKRIEAIYN